MYQLLHINGFISGYMEAVVIPGGARNIHVAEMHESNNYLALRNDRGEYYLNGHWFIQVCHHVMSYNVSQWSLVHTGLSSCHVT